MVQLSSGGENTLNINIDFNGVSVNVGRVVTNSDGSINCNGLPYGGKKECVDGKEYMLVVMAFGNCKSFVGSVIEVMCDDGTVYALIRCTVENIRAGKVEVIVNNNPKKILEMFIQDMGRFNSREEGYDYGEMFKFTNTELFDY